jgi:DNA-binding beta-propeller fold protein YncE
MTDENLGVVIGSRRYRIVRPWGNLPKGIRFTLLSQIAVDSSGAVYVFQRGDPPVVVFDRSGEYARSFGTGVIADAHGIAISRDDRVFLVDRDAHQIVVTDKMGVVSMRIGERHRPHHQAPFNHPTDLDFAPSGDIYVSDGYGNSMVHRFSASGEHKGSWGRPGTGPGEFSTPHGVCVLQDGRVLVGDRENNRIQIFDGDGAYMSEWRDFYHPMDIYADATGIVHVSDQIPRLTALDGAGRVVGRCRPVWNGGHGIAGDRQGNIYLAEQNPSRVTKLEPLPA